MRKRLVYKIVLFFIFLSFILLISCQDSFLPKPIGYHRILIPDTLYQLFDEKDYPYSFEYSVHAKYYPDTSWISEPFWLDLFYPYFNATIQITYKKITADSLTNEYLTDSYRLTAKHNIKAYAIDEKVLYFKSGNVATVNELEGDVPTQFQFHITDSIKHFMRGSLYFQSTKNDSLRPSIDFIKNDLIHLLSTLKWKE